MVRILPSLVSTLSNKFYWKTVLNKQISLSLIVFLTYGCRKMSENFCFVDCEAKYHQDCGQIIRWCVSINVYLDYLYRRLNMTTIILFYVNFCFCCNRATQLLELSHVRLDREKISEIDDLDCLGPITHLYLQKVWSAYLSLYVLGWGEEVGGLWDVCGGGGSWPFVET